MVVVVVEEEEEEEEEEEDEEEEEEEASTVSGGVFLFMCPLSLKTCASATASKNVNHVAPVLQFEPSIRTRNRTQSAVEARRRSLVTAATFFSSTPAPPAAEREWRRRKRSRTARSDGPARSAGAPLEPPAEPNMLIFVCLEPFSPPPENSSAAASPSSPCLEQSLLRLPLAGLKARVTALERAEPPTEMERDFVRELELRRTKAMELE